MDDPYKILGVSPSATEDEITQAYRKLAKKYHPDLNPGDKSAEEKMRQVNAAYEQIKNQKTGGARYERPDGSYGPRETGRSSSGGQRSYRGEDPFGGFDFGGFGDIFGDIFGGAWQEQQQRQTRQSANGDSPMMRQARVYVQNRQFRDALRVLEQMPKKTAEWYFLSAIANAGTGNRVTALGHAKTAVRMDPGNGEYQELLDSFEQGSFTYRQEGQRRGFNMQRMGRTLLQLLMAQMFCFICCRPC